MRRMGANEQASGLWAKAYRVSDRLSLGSYSASGTLWPFCILHFRSLAAHHISCMLQYGGGFPPHILPFCCPLSISRRTSIDLKT